MIVILAIWLAWFTVLVQFQLTSDSTQLGVFGMRFEFVALVLAGFVVAACSTTTEEDSSTAGDGGAVMNKPVASDEGRGPRVMSQQVGSGESAGSAEEFVIDIGDRVFFGFDRYILSPEARAILEKQSAWLLRYPAMTVSIAGHTDERGTREYNLALGERRANSVKDYLVALGVDSGRIRTISYGKERPVDPNSAEGAWAKNRRGVTMIDKAAVSEASGS